MSREAGPTTLTADTPKRFSDETSRALSPGVEALRAMIERGVFSDCGQFLYYDSLLFGPAPFQDMIFKRWNCPK